jgi:uncharacterized membrane protein YhaH (DUF805 family)
MFLFAQRGNDDAGAAGAMGMMCGCGVFYLAIIVVVFAILWKVFTKAGQPGWAALVPFYNHWILVTEICKKEPLWFILGFIPIANLVAGWVISQELAKKFGKSEAFGIGLFFLGPIFLAILAFGDAEYQGGGRRRRRDEYDDEDFDDRPRKRRRDDDDDDDDDRGRR